MQTPTVNKSGDSLSWGKKERKKKKEREREIWDWKREALSSLGSC